MMLLDELQMSNELMSQKQSNIKAHSEPPCALDLGNSKGHEVTSRVTIEVGACEMSKCVKAFVSELCNLTLNLEPKRVEGETQSQQTAPLTSIRDLCYLHPHTCTLNKYISENTKIDNKSRG